jgi:hypothetical protein
MHPYPHRLFGIESVPAYTFWLFGIYQTWRNLDQVRGGIVTIPLFGFIILPFALGVGYISWVLLRSRPKPVGCAATWQSDIALLAYEASSLRRQFVHLINEYAEDRFFVTLDVRNIAYAKDQNADIRGIQFKAWKDQYDEHTRKLRAVQSAYRLHTHFRYMRPRFSILESQNTDWKNSLIQHEKDIRMLL